MTLVADVKCKCFELRACGVFCRWHRAGWPPARNPQATLTSRIIAPLDIQYLQPPSDQHLGFRKTSLDGGPFINPSNTANTKPGKTQKKASVILLFFSYLIYEVPTINISIKHTLFVSLRSSNLHLKSRGNYPTQGSLASSSGVSMKTTVGITCKVRLHEMKQLNGGRKLADITLYFGPVTICVPPITFGPEKGLIRWARR